MTRFTASKGGARAIFLLVVSSAACFAQGPTAFAYQNPVTTDDGSRLFFISINRLAGTEESFRWKLFSWDAASGVHLAYDPPPEQSVTGISISGDGSLAAVRTVAPGRDLVQGILLHTETGEVEPVGKTAIISRNGRYLFAGDAVLDRVAGTSRPAPYLGAIVVGSDGSLLYTVRSGNSTTVHRSDPDGTDRAVVSVPYGLIGGFDENLTKVVVQSNYGYDPPVVFNTITGQQVDLGTVGALSPYGALLSSDGQWVTFATSSGVMLCHADAGGCRLLTTPANNTTPIAISSDASAVYAFQNLDQVLRIDTITSRTEQAFVVPGSVFPVQTPPLVPGSLVQLENASPVTHVTLNRQEIQILARSDGIMTVQIPWEATDQVQFTIVYGGDTQFEGAVSFPLTDYAPQPFPVMPRGNTTNAYRQDWSATAIDSPANPGEVVHVYAVGLGPVDCAVETNKPAPLDRLCPITRTVHWDWISPFGTSPAEVHFAGLAPGLIGVYQADVRIPPDAASGAYIELWVEPSSSGANPRLRHLTTVLVRSPG